jgi:hypothetical protein
VITLCLGNHIHQLPILIHSPPQIVLFAIDLYKDFIDKECVAITAMLPPQSSGVKGAEFDAEPAP